VSPRVAVDRLDDIAEAAFRVFTRDGYRRAQIADIAKEAGVSSGLVYRYVESKEALYYLAMRREMGDRFEPVGAAIPTPSAGEVLDVVETWLASLGLVEVVDAAATPARGLTVGAELAGIVGRLYDGAFRHRRVLRLVERTSAEWPDEARRFYDGVRAPLVQRLERYIATRVRTGHFVPVPDPAVAARFVAETVAWFAYHRFDDYDGHTIDDGVARATVVELVTRSLLVRPPTSTPTPPRRPDRSPQKRKQR
jgi:AcrR family transcriptional regulator